MNEGIVAYLSDDNDVSPTLSDISCVESALSNCYTIVFNLLRKNGSHSFTWLNGFDLFNCCVPLWMR